MAKAPWFATKEFKCRQCGAKYVQPLALEPIERDTQAYGQGKSNGKHEGYVEGLKEGLRRAKDIAINMGGHNSVLWADIIETLEREMEGK